MKPTFLFLLAIGSADTIGVLAAPVQQTRLNLYDKHEIRGYALVRRGRTINEKKVRRPGQYEKSVDCGYNDCIDGDTFFNFPSAVDRHWVQWHHGTIPNGWAEPKIVPESNKGKKGRQYPLGESGASLRLTDKVNTKYPGAAAHLYAQRTCTALDLFTGHLHVPPPCAVEDPEAAERCRAKLQAEYKRGKAKQAAQRLTDPAGPSAQQPEANSRDSSLKPEEPAAEDLGAKRRARHQLYRARRLEAASKDPAVAAKLLEAKRRKREKYYRRKAMLPSSHLVTDIAGPSTEQAAPHLHNFF
jgi:hypothetical protein